METFYPSKPRLDLSHGFFQQIRQNQFVRAQDDPSTHINGLQEDSPGGASPQHPLADRHPVPLRLPQTMDDPCNNLAESIENVLISLVDNNDKVDNRHPIIDMAEVDIDKYLPEAQPYILKAIQDSVSLLTSDLNEVASVIVNRAWEDPSYHRAAANLCSYIAQTEYLHQAEICIPRYTFRGGIITACQMIINNWWEVRSRGPLCWQSFCRFLISLYRQIRVQGNSPMGLFHCMSQALALLAKPPCVNNLEEACLLATILYRHGEELAGSNRAKMDLLMCDLRTTFLDPSTTGTIRSVLLLPLELSASSWTLSQRAQEYYTCNGFAPILN
ncbi:hypothetical protein LSAT2_032796 [Lamellibrachia satsuma]|nr:hypothetical protein LSAT2_032796 [Lamellibrachia satsuma]